MTANRGALADIRILDLSRVLAGPYATLMLADLGAEVIKVENAEGGDDSRGFTPPELDGVATYFLTINRNKKSLAIDLKQTAGRDLFLKLAEKADVVVENFRTGVVDRLGIDYESVRRINPEIIYCSISGYGRSGSHAMVPGYDPVTQAESGLMSMTGEPDGAPNRVGVSLVDVVTGMFAAQSITAAIHHRSRTGKGQYLEVCLFDTALNMLANYGGSYLHTGVVPTRSGNGSAIASPTGPYQAADGPFMIAVASPRLWQVLCIQVLERAALADDPRFVSNTQRLHNSIALDTILNEIFTKAPRAHWLERMRACGVPSGSINTVAEALDLPLVNERGLIGRVQHPTLGELPALRSPMRLSETPTAAPVAAPLLGQHSVQVLDEWLSMARSDIQALIASRVLVHSEAE